VEKEVSLDPEDAVAGEALFFFGKLSAHRTLFSQILQYCTSSWTKYTAPGFCYKSWHNTLYLKWLVLIFFVNKKDFISKRTFPSIRHGRNGCAWTWWVTGVLASHQRAAYRTLYAASAGTATSSTKTFAIYPSLLDAPFSFQGFAHFFVVNFTVQYVCDAMCSLLKVTECQ
jgi:hypothetical protein